MDISSLTEVSRAIGHGGTPGPTRSVALEQRPFQIGGARTGAPSLAEAVLPALQGASRLRRGVANRGNEVMKTFLHTSGELAEWEG